MGGPAPGRVRVRGPGLATRGRPLDLTISRFEVLLLLSFARGGRLPVMRLRDLLLVHGSSATYLVDRLTDAG